MEQIAPQMSEVIDAAGEVRERLRNVGLERFVKTSRGKASMSLRH